ncbi:MAG: Rieske 2Fe-2S domain-containing protein [Vulcanimicrobiaceae bacterium]
MSSHANAASSYDDPGTPEEISRRKFMANATLAIGGAIGLVLAIPIVGSLIPDVGAGSGTWSPLDQTEWKQLQASTNTPVKIDFVLKSKDAYLPEQNLPESVWGIKTSPAKLMQERPNLYAPSSKLPYAVVTLGFTIFSPICPHLGCSYLLDAPAKRFACPCHGSQFDYYGKHIAGPAPRGLDPLPLREQSGQAEVMWIRYQSTIPDRIVVSYSN